MLLVLTLFRTMLNLPRNILLLAALLVLATSTQDPRSLQANDPSPAPFICPHPNCDFNAWKVQFSKSYPNATENTRRHQIFCLNCTAIRQHNSQNTDYQMQLNQWTASTQTEINSHFGLKPVKTDSNPNSAVNSNVKTSALDARVSVTVPATLDYRNYNGNNYVTSVKNQGSCGCCWSFAATGQYESYLALNGFNYDLSAQAALECTSFYAPNKRVSDCSGGYFPDPFYYLSEVGSVLDSTYPYISGSYGSGAGFPTTPGVCTDQNRIFLGTGTINLYAPLFTSGGYTVAQIKQVLVTNGPQMIGMYANAAFNSYSSGTFTGCPSNAEHFINHAILLIGWTNTGWIAKNQWGTTWGNAGYIEIDFTLDCGLKYLFGSVTVANKNSNVQVVMSTNYVYSSFEHSLKVALLSFFVLFALLL